ncbi:hypothetical protein LTR66_012153 [Elasticomyces elasticus]|nr:hypothetical protein LTR66_012153 [Elasticomyces elasticus]
MAKDPSTAIGPTSLEYISGPRPLEPNASNSEEALHSSLKLDKSVNHDLLRVLLNEKPVAGRSWSVVNSFGVQIDEDGRNTAGPHSLAAVLNDSSGKTSREVLERPSKRRKSDDKLLRLPQLPVRKSVKRQRIPPLLQGLHQPPPNAGLLPSMTVEKPKAVASTVQHDLEKTVPIHIVQHLERSVPEEVNRNEPSKMRDTRKAKRNKWSEEETTKLLKAVARFGMGKWAKIASCPDYDFNGRSAVDLKDRFRVCCPDQYRKPKGKGKHTGTITASNRACLSGAETEPAVQLCSSLPADFDDLLSATTNEFDAVSSRPRKSRSERKKATDLAEIGIAKPFERSVRRSRTHFTELEDNALLQGFEKYGKSWASIRHDVELNLENRTATDIRDRIRNRFPEKYRALGLTPRTGDSTKMKQLERTSCDTEDTLLPSTTLNEIVVGKPLSTVPDKVEKSIQLGRAEINTPTTPTKALTLRAMSLDDAYANFYNEADEDDDGPITLDRSILGWPNQNAIGVSLTNTIPNNLKDQLSYGIDPRKTLKLPMPFTRSGQQPPTTLPGMQSFPSVISTGKTGPSVISLPPPSDPFGTNLPPPGDLFGISLPPPGELFGNYDVDARAESHGALTLDELLS